MPSLRIRVRLIVSLLLGLCGLSRALAVQQDIVGPAGSVTFGTQAVVLPNGNLVVTDPYGVVSGIGAVYLFDPNGVMISEVTGSSANDHIGGGGIFVLGNGNFVISSPSWKNSGAASAGAATWVSGTAGLNGVISGSNSLIGSSAGDQVGFSVVPLTNGNYVVDSPVWDDGSTTNVGAVTWCNGTSGCVGAISQGNSLIGSTTQDAVGVTGLLALSNGNYVVSSMQWNNGVANSHVGAVTWGNGAVGTTGIVSPANSLVGTTASDQVGEGSAVALANGNYVVSSPYWGNGTSGSNVGAATWGNGTTGVSGAVSAGNSLIGTTTNDYVSIGGIAAVGNNYVVVSSYWNNGVTNSNRGAATWGNGATGATTGPVSVANSLIGSSANDYVGAQGVTALSNGNYLVNSPGWSNGVANSSYGAVTWGNGSSGVKGVVSSTNSLIGTTTSDQVGYPPATALSNGNYVVAAPSWNNGVANNKIGAAVWGNGSTGTPVGAITLSNSLHGSTASDQVGFSIVALSNGNYVVGSYLWKNAGATVGASTWCNGALGGTGAVSPANSLVGSTSNDEIGGAATALSNGNYVTISSTWSNCGGSGSCGAATWGNGSSGLPIGPITGRNSLLGANALDRLGSGGVYALSDGAYAVVTENNGASNPGSIVLADGRFGAVGTPMPFDSVAGSSTTVLFDPVLSYDKIRKRLAIGDPAHNKVSLLSMDQIFAGRFE